MARNRMIKPDFWADEKIGMLSLSARLLFIGMWNFADDTGVCRANNLYLRNNIFPYDDISLTEIANGLIELVKNEQIFLGEYNSEQFIFIKNFAKHQKINRPSSQRYIKGNYEYIFTGYNNSMSLHNDSLSKDKEKEKEKEKDKDNGKENEKEKEKEKSFFNFSEKTEFDKQNAGSPLDFSTREKAINWIMTLSPSLRRTGQFPQALIEKWGIKAEELTNVL